MKTCLLYTIAAAAMICLWSGWAAAEDAKVPTTITSSSMYYNPDHNEVVFEGDVHVVREDFQLWSDKLIIYFSENNQADGAEAAGTNQNFEQDLSNVEKIVALKDVRFESQGKRGFCDRAIFFQKEEMLQMEENPRLEDGKNKISGEIIKLYIRENRSEVIGGKKRVEAIFFSRPDQVK
jgi:lipopolysaccharide export system protein LptA